jgi:hypothetical protein
MRPRPLFATAALSLVAASAGAPEPIVPIEAEPRHELKFQNRHVRLFDVQLPPGYRSLVHTHLHDGVFVNVEASETTAQELGGEVVVRPPRVLGETSFINYTKAPKAHRVANVGRTPFRVVDTEIHEGCGRFATTADAAGQSLVLENQRVRVTRLGIEPGQTVNLSPTCGMLVVLRSATLEFRSPGGTETMAADRAGFKWRDSFAPLVLANVGTAVLHGIDIVVK